ncbi:FIVAR domain-containing protein [Tamlana fucoidanivorans]|uniref:LamG-like jellyroll fold domain-containing protein n=1 Tax=Allotamlana fucoidanivorans TaxID=2583814 RepID=A0A5C4SP00_9FLAO|nr:LamG-like jellyroll fold domain-containing protein [Tamlana fucoidanivorans]TNJ46008.1 hypothetical protein FGF67_03145 [Tamlana fucoidanivorans]
MKKLIYFLFACTLFMTSCDKDDDIGKLDYTALDAIVTEAKATADESKEGDGNGDLIIGSTATLNEAIAKYEAYKTTAINQGTVDHAVNLLTVALKAYINNTVAVDYSQLTETIATAQVALTGAVEGTQIGDYIAGSKDILQNAIDIAQAILDNDSASQNDVNKADSDLNKAISIFEASIVGDADFTELNNAIASAQALLDSAVEGTNNGEYAVGSKAVLQDAIDTAQTAANNQAANQADIDQALDVLNQAIANFEAGKVVPPSYLNFDGNDYIKVNGFKAVPGGGARTCEAWIRTTSETKNIIIMSWGENVTNQKWDVRLHNANKALRVEYNGGGIVGSTKLNDGNWHHIAVVVPSDGAALTSVLLYVDGALETNTAASGDAPINSSSTNDFEIGRSAAQPDRYWEGDITDVRVWNKARSESEIASSKDARLNGNEAGLIGYFKLDEGTGTSVIDSSTNGNTGTLGGDLGADAAPLWVEVTPGFPFN